MTDRIQQLREANWRSKIQRGMCPIYEFVVLEGKRICYLDGQTECRHADNPEDCEVYMREVLPRIEKERRAYELQFRAEQAHHVPHSELGWCAE